MLIHSTVSSSRWCSRAVNVLLLITGWSGWSRGDDSARPDLGPHCVSLGPSRALRIVVTANIGIGMVTPPVGLTLFTACGIGKVGIGDVFRPPAFHSMMIATLMLVTYCQHSLCFATTLLQNAVNTTGGEDSAAIKGIARRKEPDAATELDNGWTRRVANASEQRTGLSDHEKARSRGARAVPAQERYVF